MPIKFDESRDASGRLTVALNGFPSIGYRWVAWKISRKFSLKKSGEYISGLDKKIQSYSNLKGNNVSIDWDSWCGLTVVALDGNSEPLVKKIGDYLKGKFVGRKKQETGTEN